MRVLVCGSRSAPRSARRVSMYLKAALEESIKNGEDLFVASGVCPKTADVIAEEWCETNYVSFTPYPYIAELGKSGGPARNRQMLQEFSPDRILAVLPYDRRLPSRGTLNCLSEAARIVPEAAVSVAREGQELAKFLAKDHDGNGGRQVR